MPASTNRADCGARSSRTYGLRRANPDEFTQVIELVGHIKETRTVNDKVAEAGGVGDELPF